MNIHEYQAKTLLRDYGAPVADGRVADTPQEAAAIARELGGETFVVKAQIHAGGRGKGGGIKRVKTLQELHAADRTEWQDRAAGLCGEGRDHCARALPFASRRSRLWPGRLRRLDRGRCR